MEKLNAEVFLTVAETGSFRKAAEQLGYTQAGISYIVSSMEQEIGLPLFVRYHNGVRLSEEGKQLLPQITQLEIWQRHFDQSIGELNGLKRGKIRVQIFDSISVHWIPGIVRQFHDDYPGIHIELITEEDSSRAEEMVRSGEVDCGFFLTNVSNDIDHFPLIQESLKAIVALDHPLAGEEKFPISQLGNYSYIGMEYAEHTGIQAIFDRQKVTPRTIFTMDNDYAAMAMVAQNIGFAIFPELLLKMMPSGIKSMEFDVPQKRVISIGTASTATCSKACSKFIAYTRKWVKEHTVPEKSLDR